MNGYLDPEEIIMRKMNKGEYMNKTTHSTLKKGFPMRRGQWEKHLNYASDRPICKTSYSGRRYQSRKERQVPCCTQKKKCNKAQSVNSDDDYVTASSVHLNHHFNPCRHHHEKVRASGRMNPCSRHNMMAPRYGNDKMNLGVAGRTRLGTGTLRHNKHVSPYSSGDSDSMASDAFDNSDNEEFNVEFCHGSNDYVEATAENDENHHRCENCHCHISNGGDHDKRALGKRKIQLSDASSKINNEGKSWRMGELPRENKYKKIERENLHSTNAVTKGYEKRTRTLCRDSAASEEIVKEACDEKCEETPSFMYSKHTRTAMVSDEPEGIKKVNAEDISRTCPKKNEKLVPPFNSANDTDHNGHNMPRDSISDSHGKCENEKTPASAEFKKPAETKQASTRQYDLCRMLADSVMGKGDLPGFDETNEAANQESQPQNQSTTLPLKFRFEDEVPKEVEKTDYEKEMDGLFSQLDCDWALSELKEINYPEPEVDKKGHAGDTQHDRCTKGEHELVIRDDEGLICMYCNHVELGPKDILPPWADKVYRGSDRKRPSIFEGLPEFDDFNLQSLMDDAADCINGIKGTVWNIKPGIRETMYEHQQEGFEFLWKNLAGSIHLNELKTTDSGDVGGCIISHAPGTGKTRLTIVFIETYLKVFPNSRPVIIAPASMLLTWEEEFRKWDVDFPFFNLNNSDIMGKENDGALKLMTGTKRQNKDYCRMVKLFSWNKGRSILGISYSLFEKLTFQKRTKDKTVKKNGTVIHDNRIESVREILFNKPGLVILDEGHTPRNQRSNIWNVLLKLQTEKRVILSGTPFQNNFAELFNTLRLVRPSVADALAQERTFSDMITSRGRKKGEKFQFNLNSQVVDRAVDKLKVAMLPFVHVHKGTILRKNLPGLRDCVVLLKPPALQKSLIESLEGSRTTFEFEHKVALTSVHPYLYQHSDSTEDQRTGIDREAVEASKLNPSEGAKTKFIMEIVHLSNAVNEKVLIFSQYIQPLELIKEHLKEIFKWIDGKQILQLQGKLDQKQRQLLINVFNDPKSESKVMLASTRCCSEGISLVGASRVILLDVLWNPSVERQAICRAYRIGQKKVVYTYHLMTVGTIEADKYCRQAEKERLSELVFTSSSNESNKEKHSSAAIEDRFLEEMVGNPKLKEMFEKIINQPKDSNLIETFGLTS